MFNATSPAGLTATQLVDESLNELAEAAEKRTPQLGPLQTSTVLDTAFATVTWGLPSVIDFGDDVEMAMKIVGAGRAANVVGDIGTMVIDRVRGSGSGQQVISSSQGAQSRMTDQSSSRQSSTSRSGRSVELSG